MNSITKGTIDGKKRSEYYYCLMKTQHVDGRAAFRGAAKSDFRPVIGLGKEHVGALAAGRSDRRVWRCFVIAKDAFAFFLFTFLLLHIHASLIAIMVSFWPFKVCIVLLLPCVLY